MCLDEVHNFPQLTWLENQDLNPGLFKSKAEALAVICLCYLVFTGRKSTDASVQPLSCFSNLLHLYLYSIRDFILYFQGLFPSYP